MSKNVLFGAAALTMAAMLGAGAANAGHIAGSCMAELNAVEAAINDGVFVGRRAETDRTNLLAKLDAADAKVDLEKYSDAVDKLMDISDKATDLAGAAKPKLVDASAINDAVGVAIGCVGGL